jgi:uncharacterized membrane protein
MPQMRQMEVIMTTTRIIKLVAAALMAAMTCVVTVFALPSPAGGYIHPGDGFVVLSGIILGPFFGGLAAGIGSMLADLILGFSGYAAATFLIKCLAAIVAYYMFTFLHRNKAWKVAPIVFGAVSGGIIVTLGYFIFEAILLDLGFATAFINVPFNLIQNCFGIIVSILLFPLLLKVPQIRGIMNSK